MNNLLSNAITTLRFPLACAVVLIHSHLTKTEINPETILTVEPVVRNLFHYGIASSAVPLFFTISGFLFFHNVEEFGITGGGGGRIYLKKLKSRFSTLFIPYLCWNTIVLIRALLMEFLTPSLRTSIEKPFSQYSLPELLDSFFCITYECPPCYQFWFVRDLIVLTIISPLIFFIIKYLRQYFVILLAIIWLFITKNERHIAELYTLDFRSLLFFSTGGWLAIHKINFLHAIILKRKLFLITFIILLITWTLTNNIVINKISIITSIPAIVGYTAYGLQNGSLHNNPFLTPVSFFIFAYHGGMIHFLNVYICRNLPIQNDLTIILSYLLTTLFVVCLGVALYYLLHKYLPKFTNIICGSR